MSKFDTLIRNANDFLAQAESDPALIRAIEELRDAIVTLHDMIPCDPDTCYCSEWGAVCSICTPEMFQRDAHVKARQAWIAFTAAFDEADHVTAYFAHVRSQHEAIREMTIRRQNDAARTALRAAGKIR